MPKICLLQSYYDDLSKRYLSPSAVPVDASFNRDHPLYEYNIFKTLLEKKVMDPVSMPCGLVSWRFETKTLISIDAFTAFCEEVFAIGADVAFINPMIAAEAIYLNVWEQGDHSGHKGMQEIVAALFSWQQLLKFNRMPRQAFAFCNYFVGNQKFWQEYIAFCDDVLERIEALKESNTPLYHLIYGSAKYHRNEGADFRPFILERLFSTFLLLNPGIKSRGFQYTPGIYEKKFGAAMGKDLLFLSEIKNKAIYSDDLKGLEKWDELRNKIVGTNENLGLMDDPEPKQLIGSDKPHRIFQGYFDEVSKQALDPAGVPVDISFNLNHQLYEYNIFKTLLEKGIMNPQEGPVGLVSWKFETKTLVPLSIFSDFCEKAFAADADVAFINPMIAAEAMYGNVWEQGEHVGHKGMLAIANALFTQKQAEDVNLMPAASFAFCNYFVGNAKFWSQYIAFCDGILSKIERMKESNPPVYNLIYSSASYHRNAAADFRPFILERLFSSFLRLNPRIRRANFQYGVDMYEKKFGAQNGKYLFLLSGLKNNGIYSRDIQRLRKWDEMRQVVLNSPIDVWLKDDPQPTG